MFYSNSFSNHPLAVIALITPLLTLGGNAQAAVLPVALNGQVTLSFTQNSGTAPSILVDLGGGAVPTGEISWSLDTSTPKNSFESFDFDTMTVVEELDVLISAPLFDSLGIGSIGAHSSYSGTFSIVSPSNPVAGGSYVAEIDTLLTGSLIMPAGSPFAAFAHKGNKKQSVSGSVEAGPDGTLIAKGTWTKTWSSTASILDPNNPLAPPIPLNSTGIATLSAVPVPATVWLFGSGLLGLIGIAKRKKA